MTSESALREAVRFPAVVKTSVGTASRGIWFVREAGDLEGAVRELAASNAFAGEVLVQECSRHGREGAIGVCRGQLLGFHAYRQVAPGIGGGEAIKESVGRPNVRDMLAKIGERLAWHGALSIDYLMPEHDATPRLIDCNPRLVEPMSAYLAGTDLVGLLLQVSRGETPAALPESRAGVRTHLAMQALLGLASRGGTRRDLLRECWRLWTKARALCRKPRGDDAGANGLAQRGAAGDDGRVAAGAAEIRDRPGARRLWRASPEPREHPADRERDVQLARVAGAGVLQRLFGQVAREISPNVLADLSGRFSLSDVSTVLAAWDDRSFANGRGRPAMKTILVPTQNIPAMGSTLETAVLLAQRTGAYIEGIPLWFGAPEFVVAELASGFSMEVYRARREDETAGARKLFETFMQEHGIPAARTIADRPWFGWFDAVSPGEDLVGSHGRTFDVIVMSRPDADTAAPYNRAIEVGAVRKRPACSAVAADRSETDRDQHHDPLERQYRAGPRQRFGHAVAAPGRARDGVDGHRWTGRAGSISRSGAQAIAL